MRATMRPATRRLLSLATAVAAALLPGACRQDEEPVGPGRDRVVVHAVLDPAVTQHVLLLERGLSGATAVDTTLSYDSTDAVVSRGAVPVSGARVVVASENGDSAVAIEDLAVRGDGKGAGMYRFWNAAGEPEPGDSAVAIVPGRRYALRIETAAGETVRGETTVPTVQPATPTARFTPFERASDSVFVWWNPVPGAARYALRIESPRGPFRVFVDSAEYLIAGTLRNTSATNLPPVFVPGFVQRVTVGAVDRNYLDWYRSSSDPYTGAGLVSHLEGALGVFGSHVMVSSARLTVTDPLDDPIEGDWDRVSAPGPTVPDRMRIYIDFVDRGTIRLSGNWARGTGVPTVLPGLLGDEGTVRTTIALLAGQSARDTLDVMILRHDANRLTGTMRSTGEQVEFARRLTP